ncbi:alpha/beta fold hydrolase [soil metagenome]
MAGGATPFEALGRGGNVLRGERVGEGPVLIQTHGLTATRRYVTHGSRHLERNGFQVVSYDARGHGESDPAPDGEGYSYEALAEDLGAVIASVAGKGRVVLAGHSMGAHTATAFALRDPERIAGLVAIGPASLGEEPSDESKAYWDHLAEGLARDGVDGFIDAYDDGGHNPEWRETVLRLARQRLELHAHPDALAQALREVPRSVPFSGPEAIEDLALPTLVVASRDDADSGHPYAIGAEWAERIPDATLTVEDEGESPLAWQGGKLSRAIEEFCDRDAVRARLDA